MVPNSLYQPGITDADIRALKQKFSFLSDYTDTFIRHATPECLVSWSQPTLYLFLPICEGALQLKLYFIDCYPRTGTVPLIFEIYIYKSYAHNVSSAW